MTPTTLDEIRALINTANNLINLLDSLLTTGRPQLAQRVIYIGVKFYLQMLVDQLEQIARELAIEEIQEIVHPSFTGNNSLGMPIGVWRIIEIRDALEACREGVEELYPIACIVALINSPTNPMTEIEPALDMRLSLAGDQLLPLPSGYSLISQTSSDFTFQLLIGGSIQSFTGLISTQPNTSAQSAATVDTYIWIPSTVFGGFTNNPLPEEQVETRIKQSQYGYLALRLAWDLYPQSPPYNSI